MQSISRRIAYDALMVALAMIFSYVEALIPINFGVPGMKLGIANLVIVSGIYLFPIKDVLVIQIARILLTGAMFGNGMSVIYSLAGGMLSFAVMLVLKKIKGFSIIGVSIAGGVSHNIGQLIVASIVVQNLKVMYYGPALLIAGVITGAVIGVVCQKMLPILKKIPGVNGKNGSEL